MLKRLNDFWNDNPIIAFLFFIVLGFMCGEAFKVYNDIPTVFELRTGQPSE